MRKKVIIAVIIGVGLVILGGVWALYRQNTKPANRSGSVPTLYVHGYGASARSTNSMVHYAEVHNHAQKVLTATVSATGQVQFTGNWPKGTRHPLIQVVFSKNKYANYQVTQKWFGNVIKKLGRDYHIQKYNTVSHSMGNLTTMYYQVNHGKTNGPQLQKQVNLAGHFDGIVGMDDQPNRNSLLSNGAPKIQNRYFRYLEAHRHGYPFEQVDVLNIYGNLQNGTNSDGDVTVVSARSLKYLLRGEYKSYREVEIDGQQGQHSRLHENSHVDRVIGEFLWGK